MAGRITVGCWNLHGSAGPDLDEVAAVLAARGADIVCLQEVQAGQAAAVTRRLGFDHHQWWFKHWPVVRAPEGLAVLSAYPFAGSQHRLRLRGAPLWSHRRRVAGRVGVDVPGGPVDVWVSHLSSGADREARLREASDLVDQMGRTRTVLAADLNARPDSRTVRGFVDQGFADAVAAGYPGDDPPTNWAGPASTSPDQRLDYVLVSDDLEVVDADVPDVADGEADWRALSDHLPITVTLRLPK